MDAPPSLIGSKSSPNRGVVVAGRSCRRKKEEKTFLPPVLSLSLSHSLRPPPKGRIQQLWFGSCPSCMPCVARPARSPLAQERKERGRQAVAPAHMSRDCATSCWRQKEREVSRIIRQLSIYELYDLQYCNLSGMPYELCPMCKSRNVLCLKLLPAMLACMKTGAGAFLPCGMQSSFIPSKNTESKRGAGRSYLVSQSSGAEWR